MTQDTLQVFTTRVVKTATFRVTFREKKRGQTKLENLKCARTSRMPTGCPGSKHKRGERCFPPPPSPRPPRVSPPSSSRALSRSAPPSPRGPFDHCGRPQGCTVEGGTFVLRNERARIQAGFCWVPGARAMRSCSGAAAAADVLVGRRDRWEGRGGTFVWGLTLAKSSQPQRNSAYPNLNPQVAGFLLKNSQSTTFKMKPRLGKDGTSGLGFQLKVLKCFKLFPLCSEAGHTRHPGGETESSLLTTTRAMPTWDVSPESDLHGYLAHEKPPPRRTLQ